MHPGTRLTRNGRKSRAGKKVIAEKIETGNYDGEAGE